MKRFTQLAMNKYLIGLIQRRSLNAPTNSFRKHPPLFSCDELDGIRPGVYRIEEKYFESWNRANVFFIEGKDRNLLVDTGTGLFDLPKFLISQFGDRCRSKPLTIFLTHLHFDHSGGLRQFQSAINDLEICVNPDEIQYLTCKSEVKRKYATASWIMNYEVTKLVDKKCQNFERDYNVQRLDERYLRLVTEGDSIQLGPNVHDTYKVIGLPGHTRGSIGLHNPHRSLIISGDALYSTNEELIDWYPPGSSVSCFSASVKRILDLTENHTLSETVVLPGHNEVIVGSKAVIECGNRHLQMCSRRRMILKFLSRFRACSILFANALFSRYLSVPEVLRTWIMK